MQLNEFLQQLTLKDYITLFGSIWEPNKKRYSEFELWPEQRNLCDFVEKVKVPLIPKTRQGGISEIAAERALKECLQYPNTEGVIISKSEDFAEYFLSNKVIRKIENLPKHNQIEWPKITKKTSSELYLSNGSTLKSLSSSKTSAASMRLDFIIFDEAGGIDENYGNFKQLFANALPALDQNKNSWSMVIGTSVPGSYYNEMVRTAYEDKKSEFKYYFLPWNIDPKRDEVWYEKQKKLLGDDVFLQFPRTIEDFFFVKEGLVFKNFDHQENGRHIRRVKPNWNWDFYVVYDHGYIDPACALFCLYDKYSDQLHVFDELFYKKGHQTEVNEIAKTLSKKLELMPKNPKRMIADTAIFNRVNSVVSTETHFRRYGIKWSKADKFDQDSSRALLSERFTYDKITIDPGCIGFIDELKSWRWGRDGVTPEDKNNHSIDAARYLCSEINPRKRPEVMNRKRQEYSADHRGFLTQNKVIKEKSFGWGGNGSGGNANSWQGY